MREPVCGTQARERLRVAALSVAALSVIAFV